MSSTNSKGDQPTPGEVLGELAQVYDDPPSLVGAFRERVKGKALAEFHEQLLIAHATQVLRARTRTVELAVDAEIRAGVSPVVARKMLRSEGFVHPTDGWVPWLEATAEQHEERAEYLEAKAAGVMVTAQRHRQAADDIRNAGATCLADITDAA
jgi:hypothetical protein